MLLRKLTGRGLRTRTQGETILDEVAECGTTSKSLRSNHRLTLSLLVILNLSGCMSLHEEPLTIPHGTSIQHAEMPQQLRSKLNLPDSAIVERCGSDPENASYRIEFEDGSIFVIGPDGSTQGGIL